MAKNTNTKSKTAKARAAAPLGAFGGANIERVQADQARRRSGAAGSHASSMVRRDAAAGRKTRVGNRSARRHAAVRDYA